MNYINLKTIGNNIIIEKNKLDRFFNIEITIKNKVNDG